MLTLAQKKALTIEIRTNLEKMKQVSPEEIAAFPAEVTEVSVPTCQGDTPVFVIASTTKHTNRPLMLNFHGGGFIAGRQKRDELFCRKLACTHDAVVLDVDYKLAPQYPFPAAVLQSWDVALWAKEHAGEFGADPEKMVLVGHSAGGNLVAGVCMRGGDTGLLKPLCAVIDYAPMDLATDPGEKERSICDMPAEQAKRYNEMYVAPELAKDPYVSPLFAPDALLEGFPNTLIITAGEDSLCNEAEEFALRLIRAGVYVSVQRFTDSVHGFIINRCCQWQEGIARIHSFLRSQLNESVR